MTLAPLRFDPEPRWPVRLVARLAGLLLPRKGPLPARPASILVVRTDDRVGNALLTIPLVRALQKALPETRIDLLLARRRAVVAEGLPNLRVVPFEKTDAFRHPLRFLQFLWRLRKSYQVSIDAAHWHAFSLTSALLSRWTAERAVIGPARGPRIYNVSIEPRAGLRETEQKLLLGEPFGVRPAPLETSLGLALPCTLAPPFVALNPGARKADHRWPAAQFAELARRLREERGLRSVVFWGPGEETLAREVAESAHAELAPPTDLDALAAAFRAAALVVANDTGPMHLAAACGAPVLAILLDDSGRRWTHDGPRFAALVSPDAAQAAAAALSLLDSAGSAAEPAPSPEAS